MSFLKMGIALRIHFCFMAKYPFMQFYTGDWLKDPSVSLCSALTRGVWIDLICAMHESDRSGKIKGSPDQLARLCRCSASEISHALDELSNTNTADVMEHNGVVTVVNRRMSKEYDERVKAAKRQKNHRDKRKEEPAFSNKPVDAHECVPKVSRSHNGAYIRSHISDFKFQKDKDLFFSDEKNNVATRGERASPSGKDPSVSSEEVARFFMAKIVECNPKHLLNDQTKRDKKVRSWAQEIDRMMRLDHREKSEIEVMIEWVTKHDFWASNIMSPKKLREKWDTLDAQKRRDKSSNKNGLEEFLKAYGKETEGGLNGQPL